MKKTIILSLIILGTIAFGVSRVEANIYGSSLVGWWTLDSNDISGSTVTDLSGTGNNGTLQNSQTQVIGKLGQALIFNGANNYIDAGNASSFVNITNGTLSAWIKTSNAGASFRAIIVKEGAFSMFLIDNVFGIYNWGLPGPQSSGVNLADNKWHNVVVTFQSGVTNGTLLYIDGKLVLTTTMTNTSETGHVEIGNNGSNSQEFTGVIDDSRVYNRILSASEVQQLYYQSFGSHAAF